MTLEGPMMTGGKMATTSTSPKSSGNNSGLSFSISRLLDTSDDVITRPSSSSNVNESNGRSKDAEESSSVDVDDEESCDDDDDEEDVKVNSSSDDEEDELRSSDPKMMLDSQAIHSHHGPSSMMDWYTLYALQHQQQHPHLIFPGHLINSGHQSPYPRVPNAGRPPGTASSPALFSPASYLSYGPATPQSAAGINSGSSSFASPQPMSGLPPHSPLSPVSMAAHMAAAAAAAGGAASAPGSIHPPPGGINSAGIPNAFAALLEATVFKDRLAAGESCKFNTYLPT